MSCSSKWATCYCGWMSTWLASTKDWFLHRLGGVGRSRLLLFFLDDFSTPTTCQTKGLIKDSFIHHSFFKKTKPYQTLIPGVVCLRGCWLSIVCWVCFHVVAEKNQISRWSDIGKSAGKKISKSDVCLNYCIFTFEEDLTQLTKIVSAKNIFKATEFSEKTTWKIEEHNFHRAWFMALSTTKLENVPWTGWCQVCKQKKRHPV